MKIKLVVVVVVVLIDISKPGILTKTGHPGWKIAPFRLGSYRKMGCDLRRMNFPAFSVCSADLDIIFSGSISHLVEFKYFYVYAQDLHPAGFCKWWAP